MPPRAVGVFAQRILLGKLLPSKTAHLAWASFLRVFRHLAQDKLHRRRQGLRETCAIVFIKLLSHL